MRRQAVSIAIVEPHRFRLMAALVFLLAAAQLLFAAHAASNPDELADHTAQTCEVCLAGAISDDPHDLAVRLSAPIVSYAAVSRPVAADVVVADALIAASPRGPPLV